MANQIIRDIYVLRDASSVAQQIEYVQGTNALDILFRLRDYNIPSGANAKAYVHKPSTKGEYDAATIEGNSVLVDVKDTMFSEIGKNFLQICIVNGEDTLVTFDYPVVVKKNHVPGIVDPSQNKSDFLDEYLGNIEEKIIQTNELIDTATELSKEAVISAENAASSANNAANSEANAKNYMESALASAKDALNSKQESETAAVNAAQSESNALSYSNNAKASEKAAALSEQNAKTSEENALTYSQNAQAHAEQINGRIDEAATSADSAKKSAEIATTKASEASASANTATTKANEAATSASGAANSATVASNKATEAAESAENASASATTATNKANAAATSEANAKSYANTATTKASSAASSAQTAAVKADAASSSASEAATSEENASKSASAAATSEENAEYYYNQARSISESFSGALRPMGTIAFANLPSVSSAGEGDMYNISDQFTTTAAFKEGSGVVVPAGSNVYKTVDGYWDVLAGSPVTGVKGNAESAYRKGLVNITPANIGLGNVPNVTTNNQTPTYTKASALANLVSGEKLSISFGKIMKAIADLISHLADKSNPHGVSLSDFSTATQSAAGIMSPTDKVKLDGIEDGANAYTLPQATASVLGGAYLSDSYAGITTNSAKIALSQKGAVTMYKELNEKICHTGDILTDYITITTGSASIVDSAHTWSDYKFLAIIMEGNVGTTNRWSACHLIPYAFAAWDSMAHLVNLHHSDAYKASAEFTFDVAAQKFTGVMIHNTGWSGIRAFLMGVK